MRTARILVAFGVLALVAAYAYFHSSGVSGVGSRDAEARTQISDLTKGKLISADGRPYVFPAHAPASSIQYYAIYYSARWCPTCQVFSPVLVEWYKKFKPSHPNFELIFVSEDNDAASMLRYMKEMAMPWPAVRFDDLKHDGNGTLKGSGIEQFAGIGPPDLVLVNAGGKVLSDSFTWTGTYLGPLHVLDDIGKLVPFSAVKPVTPPPTPPAGAPVARRVVPPTVPTSNPARFGDLKRDANANLKGSGIEQSVGGGPRDLVSVNAGGAVLSDSFTWNGSYLGPRHVIDEIGKLVPVSVVSPVTPPPTPPAAAPVAKRVVPAPAPVAAPAAPDLYSIAIKPWAPPDVMPAHPNWTWTTLEGTTYQDVVVISISPDTVSIRHAMGVTHDIHISDLPPEIRKQLNYDTASAATARAETRREEEHPFYTLDTLTDAQAVARQMHWPLAWLSTSKDDITTSDTSRNDETELTAMALNDLKDKSIIIFVNAYTEMPLTPPIVHHQFSKYDDGALPGGANYMLPKVVFSTPDVSTILGRVSYTQMKASGELAIDEAVAAIAATAKGTPPPNGPMAVTPAPSSPPAIVPAQPAPPAGPVTDTAPSPPAVKPWAPPDVMPAKPNWTWTTSDGTTYQNVVVTTIGPETVSIAHSMGVTHDIPIAQLPPDIQKQLNYDPVAAAAGRAESEREAAHPYYAFVSLAEAERVASQMHWPLAWVVSGPTLLSASNPEADSPAGLTQMSMEHLKSQSIVLYVDGYSELTAIPAIIRAQLFILDDGPLPDGHHFNPPKIVFSNPEVSKILGRVSNTQMKASGAAALDEVLASIQRSSSGTPPSTGETVAAVTLPASVPAVVPSPTAPPPPSVEAATALPAAIKPWAPPDVMPAKPNWTWNALDGRTYLNVVVTSIEPDTVTITHSLGVAHLPIIMLPPDIQKLLNYDPHAASALPPGQ